MSDDEPNVPWNYVPDVVSSEQGATDMEDDHEELALHDNHDTLDADDRRIIYAAIMNIVVTELYSPERVAKVCRKFKLTPGCAFDLQTGWDLTKEDQRQEVRRRVKREKPTIVIGSPPCTMVSQLQELSWAHHAHNPEWRCTFLEKLEVAKGHVRFC